MNAIEIRNLTFSYDGRRKILDGLNLDIKRGDFVGIVGDSGCGKSTLCHILCGIIPYAIGGELYGDVTLYDGFRLRDLELKEMAERIGFVMQDSDRQIVSTTVEDELAFGPENMCVEPEEIRRRVDETCAMLGIENLKDINPNRLSGGQKQLVTIGSVLTTNPKILMLDEPFSHLDEKAGRNLSELIFKLKAQGKTVLVVEHDHDAIENADRRICIKDGNIEREY